MKIFLLFIVFFLFSGLIYSQQVKTGAEDKKSGNIENAYENFRQTFDKEIGSYPGKSEPEEVKYVSFLKPSALPDWFFSPIDFDNEHIFVAGISDPGLDSTVALMQATLRAKALLAILYNSEIKNITDDYTNEHKGDKNAWKFTTYSQIKSKLNYSGSLFRIVKKAYTGFGEAIILAAFPVNLPIETTLTDSLLINTEIFLCEKGLGDDINLYSFYSLEGRNYQQPGDEPDLFESQLHKTGKSIEISSSINDETFELEYGRFKYFFDKETNYISETEEFSFSKTDMRNGLWPAFLTCFLRQIELSEKYTTEIKNMGDLYTGKFEHLTREVSKNNLGFRIDKIFIKDNDLYLRLKN